MDVRRVQVATNKVGLRGTHVVVQARTAGSALTVATYNDATVQKCYKLARGRCFGQMLDETPVRKLLVHINMIDLAESILKQLLPP